MLRRRDSLFLFFLLGIAVIMMLYSSYIGIRNIFRYNNISREVTFNLNLLSELMLKNNLLKEKVLFIQSDAYWELLSKQQLGYKKKGENVYMFIEQMES